MLAVGEPAAAGNASPVLPAFMPDWTLLNVVASESISRVFESSVTLVFALAIAFALVLICVPAAAAA